MGKYRIKYLARLFSSVRLKHFMQTVWEAVKLMEEGIAVSQE